MTLLELQFRVGADEQACLESYMEWESAVRSPRSLMRQVDLQASEMLPGAVEVRATYADPEGDECVLTELTAEDALNNARQADDRRVLRVRLVDGSGRSDAANEVALHAKGGRISPDGSASATSISSGSGRDSGGRDSSGAHSDQKQVLTVFVECRGMLRQDTLDFEAALDSPELLMDCVDRLGHELLPTATKLLATYTDDDGDACTLSAPTSADAVALALERGDQLEVKVKESRANDGAALDRTPEAPEVGPHTCEKSELQLEIDMQAAAQELKEARSKLEEARQMAQDKDQTIHKLRMEKQVLVEQMELRVANIERELAAAQAAALAQQSGKFKEQLELQEAQKDAEARVDMQDAVKQAEEAYMQDKALMERQLQEATIRAEDEEKRHQEHVARLSEQLARSEQAAATAEMKWRSKLEAAEVRMQAEIEQANQKVLAAEEASRQARAAEGTEAAQASKARAEASLLQGRLEGLEDEVRRLQAQLEEKAQSDSLLQDLKAELEEVRRESSEAQRQANIVAKAAAQAHVKTAWEAKMSAVAVRSEPEFAVIEGHGEDPSARGDVSKDTYDLGACPSSGEVLDLPVLPIGPVQPCQRTEVQLDLRILQAVQPASTPAASMWVLRDAATSKPLGPVLIFEVKWEDASSSELDKASSTEGRHCTWLIADRGRCKMIASSRQADAVTQKRTCRRHGNSNSERRATLGGDPAWA
eukprot:CAMPEP_0115348142 /NCGR_PEP_ID=MMETSP0270-20121206/95258_1 /TAXON_ID=71861 /ORGANISM="Scrippsiella trochoidea, Strain CCMP3099" /LENGTH=708 /DNA_ID=CAMNT_0002770115 /DNA_START=10 /DNA_END=2135 /DNA_ORIENTATION=+